MDDFTQGNDDQYYDWIKRYPDGFVLNIFSGKKGMLHKAKCEVIRRPVDGHRFDERTSYKKRCSQDRSELITPVDGMAITRCGKCNP